MPVSSKVKWSVCASASLLLGAWAAQAQNASVVISIDVNANRRAINPQIHGVAHASTQQLQELNAPLNRNGGNNTTRYNWQQNADNRGHDWFFESIGESDATPAGRAHSFITNTKNAGAEPMWTVPVIDWVAKLGPNREKLASFSVAKYGAQQRTDYWMPDAGNGVRLDGSNITGNDPNDANTRNSVAMQKTFVENIVGRWNTSNAGGLRYYIMDNEPAIWYSTHRDVQPEGVRMQDLVNKTIAYAEAVKSVDPNAQIVGPEEWGWTGYLYSGYDSQNGAKYGWDSSRFPDRILMGGMDAMPWYLKKMKERETATGKRVLDVFTVHLYPQGGEFSDDVSTNMQLRRNRSTRSLWDPNYTDETWINDKVRLIPRMKEWVATQYPGTKIGITEYNWGAENHINGATTQADILGIFGREGLDMAARWTTPDANTPTFKAMKMFRNYDGQKRGFGETSVACSVPNPDNVASYAALRSSDGALTVMVISKVLSGSTPVSLNLANFSAGSAAQVWQLTSANQIARIADAPVNGGILSASVPAQSVTLFVIPKSGGTIPTPTPTPSPTPSPTPTPVPTPSPTPSPTPKPSPTPTPIPTTATFTSTATAKPNPVTKGSATTISLNVTCKTGKLSNGIVNAEVYNASGVKVTQKYWTAQSFTTGQKRSYSWKWTPTTAGTYTVKVGVFSGDWSSNPHWNNGATTITVR